MKRYIFALTLALAVCGCRKGISGVGPIAQAVREPVTVAEFSPDGHRVVTRSQDGTARIWDVQTGKLLSLADSATNGPTTQPGGQPVRPRYQARTLDNMPAVGGDNFQVLQDQIDALEKRVRELEKNANRTPR